MKNKISILLMSALLMVSFSGCTEQASTTGGEGSTKISSEQVSSGEVEAKNQSEKITQTVKVYYSDDQAENLVEKQINIQVTGEESLEKTIVESLKTKPTDSSIHSVIYENVKINSVKVSDKLAKVDLSSDGLNGSSTQEVFFKDAIILALTNLDTVDSVQFLVDGEVAETLMGHIEVSEPFNREDVQTKVITDAK